MEPDDGNLDIPQDPTILQGDEQSTKVRCDDATLELRALYEQLRKEQIPYDELTRRRFFLARLSREAAPIATLPTEELEKANEQFMETLYNELGHELSDKLIGSFPAGSFPSKPIEISLNWESWTLLKLLTNLWVAP
jgi:hypothetical protein